MFKHKLIQVYFYVNSYLKVKTETEIQTQAIKPSLTRPTEDSTNYTAIQYE